MNTLRRFKADLLIALGLLLLPLLLFWPVTLGNRTLLPADNLTAFEPFKSAATQFSMDVPPHNQLLSDLVLENYPWKRFILESLRARQLPLWNPYLFAGVPFLAAGQHSALYPFSVIFYIIPLPRAYGLFTVSQFFLAGLFAYLFVRVLGLRRLSALFGAIVYQLSLFMIVSVVFPMIVAGAVWLPLILTAIELIIRQHPAPGRRSPSGGGRPATLPWLALGAIALGMQILAGHVEITYYTLLVSGAYSLWRLVDFYRQERRGGGEGEAPENSALSANLAVKKILSRAAALLAFAFLGLALGGIQIIPLFELVRRNFRSASATFDQIIGWAYPWRHALLFLIPNLYGNPSHHAYFDLFTWQWTPAAVNSLGGPLTTIDWGQTPFKNYVEGGAYLGLLPLFLTGIVAIMWTRALRSSDERLALFRNPFIPFFLTLGFFALSFAFPTRLYALIFWLPGINQLHSPFRWMWPLSLCAAVLSAYGIEYLWRSHPAQMRFGYYTFRRKDSARPTLAARLTAPIFLWSSPSLITFFAGVAVWGGALIVAALVAARIWYEPLGVARLMDRLVAEVTFATHMFADGRMAFSYEARWVFIFALLLVASGIVLCVSRCSIYVRGRTIWEPLALGVIVLDLFVAGYGFNPAADPAIFAYMPPSVEFLRQDTGLWRFTTYDTSKCRAKANGDTEPCKPFNANIGWYFNFYDVRGYDSIFPMQYRRYMELIQPQYELDYNRIAPIGDPTALDSPLLDLLNVKYVITEEPIISPKYTLVYSAEVRIYQNLTVMPRAYIQPISATVVAEEFGAAVQKYDPRQYVIVGSKIPAGGQVSNLPPGQTTPSWPTPIPDSAIEYTPNEVTLTAATAEDAWLVLADSYFPGWKAFVRPAGAGEEAEDEISITLINGNFRGVLLEPGAWTVRFKYSPDAFKFGGVISFIAGVIILFGMGVWTWRYFYRESAVDSTARRVAKNSLAPMALNLMNRGIDLIFAAFYMRVLGPADVGKYAFAIVAFGWFEIVTNYGLNTLLTRDVSRDRGHANRYLVNTTILRLLLGVVAIPGLAILLGLRQLLPSPLTGDTLLAIVLLVLAQAPATISTGLTALFYVYEKAEYPAAVATISTIIKVTLGTVALILGGGFVSLAGTSIVVNVVTLAVLAALAVRLFFRPQWELDWGLQRGAVRESFPLMLNHLLATLFFKVDVPLLEAIRNQQEAGRGDREVGWYRTAYQFLDAYNVIPSFFTIALFPLMSRQAKEDRAALTRSYALAVKLLVAVALPLAVVTTFLAPLLVGALGGPQFLPYGAIALSIMVWSIPFGWINSVTNYLLIALDQQRGLTRAFAVALAFNVICNLIFIPHYGYPAAAAITIASEILEGAAFYWYLRKTLGPLPLFGWLWRLWVSAGAMGVVVYGLWARQPLVALMAGLGVYMLGVLFLKAFTAEEQSTLAEILPSRIRERLKLKITNATN